MANILNSTNLLKLAMSVIPPREVQYYSYIASVINGAGEAVSAYNLPVKLLAVVIEEEMAVYEKLGLSPQKLHKTLYINHKVNGTSKQSASDVFFFDNSFWRVIATNDWTIYNGWASCVVTHIQDDEIPQLLQDHIINPAIGNINEELNDLPNPIEDLNNGENPLEGLGNG